MRNYKLLSFAALAAIVIGACNKEGAYQSNINNTTAANNTQAAGLVTSICDQFAYPDTIFFKKQSSSDYIVKTATPLSGTFGVFPAGLKINTLNGNINVTKSESGLDYKVWFIAANTSDTCVKYITISGIDYTDSIYVLANNAITATPVYNATPSIPADCTAGCEFDDGADDDNGNGTADEPPAGQELIPQGIVMNKATGAINLKKSLQNGALGKNPVSGTYKDFILNYRIGDKSSKALNKIAFRLYYYQTQAQIPAKLKDELASKQSQVLIEGEEEDEDDHDGGHHGHGSLVSSVASAGTTAKHGAGEVKCRPPYIIVTQQ